MPPQIGLNATAEARDAYARTRGVVRAAFLDRAADLLAADRPAIIATAAEETGLTPKELSPEFDRTVDTLRLFAALAREGSWARVAIDSVTDNAPDVRRMLVPLGPVAVFGASNFPLAYGAAGGDVASALAAGCPVVVKEHPDHRITGRFIAERLVSAAIYAGVHEGVYTYLHDESDDPREIGTALVDHPFIRAVGFTGSYGGGLGVWSTANRRTARDGRLDPIPVLAEMGSLNTIIVLRHAFRNRREQIADDIARSLLARNGQQCTAPGVVLVAGYENADWMYGALSERLGRAEPRRMLSGRVAQTYYRRLNEVVASGAIERHTPLPDDAARDSLLATPVVFTTQTVKMEDEPLAWEEIFGPALIVVGCDMLAPGYFHIPGALTATLIVDPEDGRYTDDAPIDDAFIGTSDEILAWLAQNANRIIINGVPTGVRVCPAMVHGGPFPASNRPDTTAVGPFAIERWCRPVCFQNCPDALLPPELRDANPLNIRRLVNGEWRSGLLRRS